MKKFLIIFAINFLAINATKEYSIQQMTILSLFEANCRVKDEKIKNLQWSNCKLYILRSLLKKNPDYLIDEVRVNTCTKKRLINKNNEKIKKLKNELKLATTKFINSNSWISKEETEYLQHKYYVIDWPTSKI
ncbi:hypothetical protein M1446_00490 [Candidatus Dependentiae bacterium]|nr:hypothetical protein [Candidatus Dependentiae bacterium]